MQRNLELAFRPYLGYRCHTRCEQGKLEPTVPRGFEESIICKLRMPIRRDITSMSLEADGTLRAQADILRTLAKLENSNTDLQVSGEFDNTEEATAREIFITKADGVRALQSIWPDQMAMMDLKRLKLHIVG